MNRTAFAATIGAAILAAASAQAGSLFQVTTSDSSGAVTDTSEIKAEDAKLAMSAIGAGGMMQNVRMIFRGDLEPPVMYAIDDSERAYYVMEPEAMAAGMADMQSQVQAAMAAAMQNLTPEQRAQMEAAMGGMGGIGGAMGGGAMGGLGAMPGMPDPDSIRVAATGEARTIAGVPTRGYEVTESGARAAIIWAAAPNDFSGASDLAASMAGMSDFMSRMPFAAGAAAMYDMGALEGGVPVQVETYANGALDSVSTISPGQPADFPDSDFEPDPSYSQQQMFGGL